MNPRPVTIKFLILIIKLKISPNPPVFPNREKSPVCPASWKPNPAGTGMKLAIPSTTCAKIISMKEALIPNASKRYLNSKTTITVIII